MGHRRQKWEKMCSRCSNHLISSQICFLSWQRGKQKEERGLGLKLGRIFKFYFLVAWKKIKEMALFVIYQENKAILDCIMIYSCMTSPLTTTSNHWMTIKTTTPFRSPTLIITSFNELVEGHLAAFLPPTLNLSTLTSQSICGYVPQSEHLAQVDICWETCIFLLRRSSVWAWL